MAGPRLTREQRQAIRNRAGGCCEYCRSREDYSTSLFSIEHVVPAARGGAEELDNLALSCQECNNHKYTHTESVDPVTGLLVPLYNPRRDPWDTLRLGR